jgi:hypothetical protein
MEKVFNFSIKLSALVFSQPGCSGFWPAARISIGQTSSFNYFPTELNKPGIASLLLDPINHYHVADFRSGNRELLFIK